MPVPAGEILWRPMGSFDQNGKTATPTGQRVRVPAFHIMADQVSQQDYAECVQHKACTETKAMGQSAAPQTNLSWYDAQDYAAWLSDKTGKAWRLPTDREWQRAADTAFGDPAPEADGRDPGQRMLEQYEQGIFYRGRADLSATDSQTAARNRFGLAGISDRIWEWTDSCMQNGQLDADGRVRTGAAYCGARVVGGQHQALIIDFVRDASVGGCSVGLPPDFLGIRLVHD
ncbi:formylglycine-generating enzyme family protein [Antarcticimicrobium luteum]|uniref:Formylglycine-generating enzyme family protein n=1 Tax=Antarcticimicrobium luteum TaxID=2547397 RepID=A0A4R5UTG8_9RHOB|nr:formylglycine-generating enzyme family protein [Antarcticimicrobium luteum]